MTLEGAQMTLVEGSLEVVGDELDELLAAEFFDVDHGLAGAMYSSSARRTRARARCRRTR